MSKTNLVKMILNRLISKTTDVTGARVGLLPHIMDSATHVVFAPEFFCFDIVIESDNISIKITANDKTSVEGFYRYGQFVLNELFQQHTAYELADKKEEIPF